MNPLLALNLYTACKAADLKPLVGRASSISWTRDPFDRLIAAHASLEAAILLTADETILEALPGAVWS